MITDLDEEALWRYRSDAAEPSDFDGFWRKTLAESRSRDGLDVRAETVEPGLRTVVVYDVTFPGFGGEPVRAWLKVPSGIDNAPVVIEYLGYGGGRGAPTDNLLWSAVGYAHLVVDTRGQGSGWSRGDTPDHHGSGPAAPGFLTRGIEDPEQYYYRRVFTDAVRAVDATDRLPHVDSERVALLGNSQGGGIALAVAGLTTTASAVFARCPFLCDFNRATRITDRDPYHEIVRWSATHRARSATALRTLSYFDGVHFAKRATAPAWFSTALMDPVCPPSTVFGAFHEYAGPKDMNLWAFNGHEGGGPEEDARTIDVLRGLWE